MKDKVKEDIGESIPSKIYYYCNGTSFSRVDRHFCY